MNTINTALVVVHKNKFICKTKIYHNDPRGTVVNNKLNQINLKFQLNTKPSCLQIMTKDNYNEMCVSQHFIG